jgi:hypothetical protein
MDTSVLDDRIQSRRNKRRRALLAILLSSSLATLGAGALSLAVFTDSAATDGSWTTGTIILGVQPATAFNVTGVMPGDSGSRDITVQNNGSARLRYAMTTAGTGALADQLNLKVTAGTCAAPGATLYDNALSGAVIGDPATGDQGADREVAATGSDALCFAWSLPKSTDDTFQGVTGSAVFTFDAEQTVHNP